MMSYKIRVSSRAIIINEGKILLNCFSNGLYYNFPGGGIEENETAKQAVVREVMEESGLTVDVGELVFSLEYEPNSCNEIQTNRRFQADFLNPACPCRNCSGTHHISFFFRCYLNNNVPPQTPSHTDINPDDPSITSEAKWVPLSDLNTVNVVPKICDPLLNYLETGIFTPSFWAECEHIL
jgi:8-oxo-dGTP pyrophosphatase MutT (NUDIX family)